MRRLVLALVALRVLVATGLILTPALDEASEFDGWDVERFQEIHDASGQAYIDFEIEYPPGSLALIELITLGSDSGESDGVVGSHRVLTVLSLLVDLGIAGTLYRRWAPSAALAYLVIGTPMIVFGMTRFDLWACLFAVGGLALSNLALSNEAESSRAGTRRALVLDTAAGILVAAGALVKLWPALLILVLWAVGRRRPAAIATILGAVAGLIWIAISGIDAVDQVLSLRGATGWQVESLGGTLTSLFTNPDAVYQANAYRVGTIDETLVALGRVAAIITAIGLSLLASRSNHAQRVPLAMLGSVAALIVTAPLLSPQFLLWLLPWTAMLVSRPLADAATGREAIALRPAWRDPTVQAIAVSAASIALTAAVVSLFGPPNLHQTLPAAVLLFRNGLLLSLVPLTATALNNHSASSATAQRPAPGTHNGPGSALIDNKLFFGFAGHDCGEAHLVVGAVGPQDVCGLNSRLS